jgi:hypothetical protein
MPNDFSHVFDHVQHMQIYKYIPTKFDRSKILLKNRKIIKSGSSKRTLKDEAV